MKQKELTHIGIALLIFTFIIALPQLINLNFSYLAPALMFAVVILGLNIGSKMVMAQMFESQVEHSLWYWQRYGLKPGHRLKKEVPAGAIVPLLLSIISLGIIKCMTLLTYETSANPGGKRKIHGYVFTEMTDWHVALIGATGIIAVLALSVISYGIPILGNLWRYAAFYAFWNMIPFSKLDGTQIFAGSRVLWTAVGLITVVVAMYAALLA